MIPFAHDHQAHVELQNSNIIAQASREVKFLEAGVILVPHLPEACDSLIIVTGEAVAQPRSSPLGTIHPRLINAELRMPWGLSFNVLA